MLFSSVTFLFTFLPITLILYFIVPQRMKNFILLVASLFFYAWGEPVYIVLMILSILFNYACGLDLEKKKEDPKAARISVIVAVVVNLLILGFFKYFGLFLDTINTVFSANIQYRTLALPIGISFYTFQALSYVIDVYRGKIKTQHNVLNFGLYVSMFPQLIAGPIVRYEDIEVQLTKRKITVDKFGEGCMFFIRGLAKKVLLANTVGEVYTQIASLQAGTFSALTAWIGCISFAFQIYFDFGGYSDMAIGLGKMFGFEFLKNFDYPYTAKSITDFWRRWHISLSTWFREYVYIPLGGNRKGTSRTIVNLMIVWALTGFWHGAAWNFLAWGLYYGLILIIEKFVLGDLIAKLPTFVQWLYSIVLVLIGWVFFFSPDLGYAFQYLGTMFGPNAVGFADTQALYYLTSNWLLYLLCIVASSSFGFGLMQLAIRRPGNGRQKRMVAGVVYLVLFLLSVVFLISGTFNPFLYFRF